VIGQAAIDIVQSVAIVALAVLTWAAGRRR
jgi:hypothetical protein